MGLLCIETVFLFVVQLADDKRRLFIDWYKQLCRIGDNVENNKPREDDNGPKPVSLLPKLIPSPIWECIPS